MQEEELVYQQRELEQLQQRYSLQDHHLKHEQRFIDVLSHDPSLSASLTSPELLRRLERSEEHPTHLHASHLSELDETQELHAKPSPMDRERPHARQTFIQAEETDQPSTLSPSPCSLTVSEHLSVLDSLEAEKVNIHSHSHHRCTPEKYENITQILSVFLTIL